MTALTGPRNTQQQNGTAQIDLLSLPVAANAVIHQGSLVAVNASGYAVPASTATTLKAAGRAEHGVDNTGGANGAKRIETRLGVFKLANSSAGDLIGVAHVLSDVFIVDDQTVAATNGGSTRSVAGKCLGVESDGVWVQVKP